MLKNKFIIALFAFLSAIGASAQQDQQARTILDRVASTYENSNGLQIKFKGTQLGTLWIKGERFVLECGGIKSWFDGQTQWSYVADNEEVNVSSPTYEELQVINPYVLATMYRKGFNYRYDGIQKRSGQQGHEVILIPLKQQDIRNFILLIDKNSIPVYIGIDMKNGHYEEFIVTHYEPIELADDFFQFNEKEYPNAEIIDLR